MTWTLTKSAYTHGLQCEKRLYLEIRKPDLARAPSASEQERIERGKEVGGSARGRFPGGVLIDAIEGARALEQTRVALQDSSCPALFEAAFEHDGVFVRADILERVNALGGQAWRLIEVKSSTTLKDEHLQDVAVQLHVLRGSGVPVVDAGVMTIDNGYVRGEAGVDLDGLFRFESLMGDAEELDAEVSQRIQALRAVARSESEPDVEPGDQCHQPRTCPFLDLCVSAPPPLSPLNLPNGRSLATKLAKLEFADLARQAEPEREQALQEALTERQRHRREAVLEDSEYVGAGLAARLRDVRFPLYFVDFEAIGPTIPRYAGTRPYEPLPFQWSCHIQDTEGGALRHTEFLHDSDSDPRQPFLESLLSQLGREGTILVYSSYEKTRLEALARDFPSRASEIQAVVGRLYDLLAVLRREYYHPDFGASYSIKAALPVLTKISYDDLGIKNGADAATEYVRSIELPRDDPNREVIRRDLLEYCCMDTKALVAVRDALLERAPAS